MSGTTAGDTVNSVSSAKVVSYDTALVETEDDLGVALSSGPNGWPICSYLSFIDRLFFFEGRVSKKSIIFGVLEVPGWNWLMIF